MSDVTESAAWVPSDKVTTWFVVAALYPPLTETAASIWHVPVPTLKVTTPALIEQFAVVLESIVKVIVPVSPEVTDAKGV